MGLYKLFSYNVEVQYKSYFLSKAMLFTVTLAMLNILLPFLVAYKSRSFWLRSQNYYEQPAMYFTYEYILVAESDDLSKPIVCAETNGLYGNTLKHEEYCVEFQVQEYDYNGDGKNDILDFKIHLNIPKQRILTSMVLILMLDFQLKTVCPLHMQSLAVINKEFTVPPSGLEFFGDLQLYQTSHLPCKSHHIDARYNSSIFGKMKNNNNIIDFTLGNYFMRDVTTHIHPIYSRSQNGNTGAMKIQIKLRIPEMAIRYIPNLMQELKWAWPQYLSLVVIFYWILNKIKMFVFNHRLVMAWEIIPFKKYD